MASQKKSRARGRVEPKTKSKVSGSVKKRARRLSEKKRAANILRLQRVHERVVEAMHRPNVSKKKPDIGAGDPLAWLMHLLFVEALEIKPEDLIPPTAGGDDGDDDEFGFGAAGVPAGELHYYLRQLRTLRVQYEARQKRFEAAAEEATANPVRMRWNEDQAERCGCIAVTLRFIFNVSYFDAHQMYGSKVQPRLLPNWQVRRNTDS